MPSVNLAERVIHEDRLLSERTASFVAANAFLAVAFATVTGVLLGSHSIADLLRWGIVGLALFLAYFELALGSRTLAALSFWRACERGQVEVEDHHLGDFYREGHVEFDNGCVRMATSRRQIRHPRGSVEGSPPWRWMPSVGGWNGISGTVIPTALGIFWVAASFTIAPLYWAGAAVAVVSFAFFLVAWVDSPSRAAWCPRRDEVLAIMGRGIRRQRRHLGRVRWVASSNFELYELVGGKPAHLPDRPEKFDRESDLCLVGGSRLNLEAARRILENRDSLCVVGFAHAAPYLRKARDQNDPRERDLNESEILSNELQRLLPDAEIERWEQDSSDPSNTEREVRNVIEFAIEKKIPSVRFLSIRPHLARVEACAARVCERLRLAGISPPTIETSIASEDIVKGISSRHARRVEDLVSSSAYKRTIAWEEMGRRRIGGSGG